MEKIKEYLQSNGFQNHGKRGIKWAKTINNSRIPVIVFVAVYQSKRWHIAVNDIEDEFLFLNAINILETEDEDKVNDLLEALMAKKIKKDVKSNQLLVAESIWALVNGETVFDELHKIEKMSDRVTWVLGHQYYNMCKNAPVFTNEVKNELKKIFEQHNISF